MEGKMLSSTVNILYTILNFGNDILLFKNVLDVAGKEESNWT